MTFHRIFAAILLGLFAIAIPAAAQIDWTAPKAIRTDHGTENTGDIQPRLATDGNGVWIAVWHTEIDVDQGIDADVYFARSTDDAATWSEPVLLSRSNNGADDFFADVATDSEGAWIIVFQSQDPGGASLGTDNDILYCVSTNNGLNFTQPGALNSTATTDNDGAGSDRSPAIASGGDNDWICVWRSNNDEGNVGTDEDIWFSQTTSDGEAWSPAQTLNSDALSDGSAADFAPDIYADGSGRWIAVWAATGTAMDPTGTDADIFFSTLPAFGSPWGLRRALNGNAETDGDSPDDSPAIVSDGGSRWYVTWISFHDFANTGDTDPDIIFSATADDGTAWTQPMVVNDDFDMEMQTDFFPRIATDRRGNLVIAWDRLSDTPHYATSSNHGATWTAAQPIVSAKGDFLQEGNPDIATNLRGQWVSVWDTNRDFGGGFDTDMNIAVAKGLLTGDILGRLFEDETLLPVTCAGVLVQSDADPAIQRFTSTDLQGRFEVFELPAGSYTLEIYPVGHPALVETIQVLPGKTTTFTRGLAPAGGNVDIEGQVTDAATGTPIAGARVTARVGGFQAGETLTCATGRFEFRDLIDSKGGGTSVDVLYESDGYDSETQNVNVESGMTTNADQTMDKSVTPLTTLSGIVFNSENDDPIPNAQVSVEGTVNNTTESDIGGVYFFDAIPDGTYTVRASAESYESTTQFANLAPGVESLDLALVPGAPATIFPADINGDGVANAVDVQLAINAVLGADPTVDADVNDDGETNAVDIQLVINAALGV